MLVATLGYSEGTTFGTYDGIKIGSLDGFTDGTADGQFNAFLLLSKIVFVD